jgi:hypothetical protein
MSRLNVRHRKSRSVKRKIKRSRRSKNARRSRNSRRSRRSRIKKTKVSRRKTYYDGASGIEPDIVEFVDFNPTQAVTVPATFTEYVDMLQSGRYNFQYEPYNIANPNAEVYVIGDLEGDSNLLYRWLLASGFINTDLQWTAGDNVYIIQCGDQLDNGIANTNSKNSHFPFYNRRPSLGADYFNLDMYLLLFTDYLSIKSNNHFLSILGNHEILNLHRDFRYVNLTNVLEQPEIADIMTLFNGFSRKEISYQRFLGSKETDIINYLERRRRLLTADGIFGKLLRRRNFIIRFNNLLVSHAGVIDTLFTDYTRTIDSVTPFDMDNVISNINMQIRVRDNWPTTNVFTRGVFNELYNIIKNPNRPNSNFADPPQFTDLFKIILNADANLSVSPIWNRKYEVPKKQTTRNMSHCLPKDGSPFTDFIVVTGHNSNENTKFCDCTIHNPCENTCVRPPKWIATDVGQAGTPFPYLEATKITYSGGNISYPMTVEGFPDRNGTVDANAIKNNSEINSKLGITTTTLENFIP